MKTWLYLYESADRRSVYIGIGNSMERVWEPHNHEAEELRNEPSTMILQTIEPFSSREDALKAEAIAIHVATMGGQRVISDLDVTNRAGTKGTSRLGPAVMRRSGEVPASTLTNTAIVPIRAEAMDERPGPYGGRAGAVFSERAQKYWTVAADKQERVTRLIAVLAGSDGVILGDWDVDPLKGYGPDGDVFPLVDAAKDDPRGVKGKRLTGIRCNSRQVYSFDLR